MSKYRLLVCNCYLKILGQNICGEHYSISRNFSSVCCIKDHGTSTTICEFCNQRLITAVGEMSERLKCEYKMCRSSAICSFCACLSFEF